MTQARLKLDFSKLSDSDLEAKSLAIVQAMTENGSYFPTPKPTMPEFISSVSGYSTQLSKAASRDKDQVALKNQLRSSLESTLMQVGYYVSNTAQGNVAILTGSGFDLVKTPVNKPPIGAPENLTLASGINIGEVSVSVDAVKGAKSYLFQYCPDPLGDNPVWISLPSSSRKMIITLEPGKKYWFRVAAIGAREQVTYTNVQPKIVS
jgi:hypothetical protein